MQNVLTRGKSADNRTCERNQTAAVFFIELPKPLRFGLPPLKPTSVTALQSVFGHIYTRERFCSYSNPSIF
jgi:hypothetical protein